MEEEDTQAIELPSGLVARIDRRRRQTGFESVEAYTTFVMEQVLRTAENEVQESDSVEAAGSTEIREKLKALGYL